MLLILGGDYVDELAQPTAIAELNRARHGRKQSVILPNTDVLAGLVASSALADYDGATRHELAREHFDTQALGIRIATVF